MASLDSFLIISASAIAPLSSPSIITKTIVFPSDKSLSTFSLEILMLSSFKYPGLTTSTFFVFILP